MVNGIFLQEAYGKEIIDAILITVFCAGCGTGSSNHFDEDVLTVVANRSPYSQRHVQIEITRGIKVCGSRGQTPRKILEDMHSTYAQNASPSRVQAFVRNPKSFYKILTKSLCLLFKNI